MAYNDQLAERVRAYLANLSHLQIEEKKMFGGLAFLINGKMCVNISGDRLMLRFDPTLQDKLSKNKGFEIMTMNGRVLNGYCYVQPEGFKTKKDFEYWVNLTLDFNKKAKSSKK